MSEPSSQSHELAAHGRKERDDAKSMAKKALVRKRVHPHVIRHTFATTLLDNNNDLKTVQALMGHSHIRTTERYLHSTDDRKVEAAGHGPQYLRVVFLQRHGRKGS